MQSGVATRRVLPRGGGRLRSFLKRGTEGIPQASSPSDNIRYCSNFAETLCVRVSSSKLVVVISVIQIIVVEVIVAVSSGPRPIPPPCLVGGSEASLMLVGISWLAYFGPQGGQFRGLLRPPGGSPGASLGLFGASWGLFGASGLLGVLLRAPGVSCGLSGVSRGGSKATNE